MRSVFAASILIYITSNRGKLLLLPQSYCTVHATMHKLSVAQSCMQYVLCTRVIKYDIYSQTPPTGQIGGAPAPL